MKKTFASKKKLLGFTLIELLAVVTIMAILFAAGLVTYTNAARNARNNRRRTDITNLRQALVLYRSEKGYYPIQPSYDVLAPYWSEPSLPMDPLTGTWTYQYAGVGSCGAGRCTFTLSAELEPYTEPPTLFTVTSP